MEKNKNNTETLGNLLDFVELADLPSSQRRDMKSAISRGRGDGRHRPRDGGG